MRKLALEGEAAPGAGGVYASAIGLSSTVGSGGDPVFNALISGGSTGSGLFADGDGPDDDVVLAGDAAPPAVGGSYGSLLVGVASNDMGALAFATSIVGGSAASGVFVHAGGSESVAALDGDSAPDTGGGSYAGPTAPSINDSGDVAFTAGVSGGSVAGGIFMDFGGLDVSIALEGEVAPDTGGGIYASLLAARISDLGRVAFAASVAGGSAASGLFLATGAVDSSLALEGGAAPDTGGGSFGVLSLSSPAINASNEVAFFAPVSGGSAASGIFLVTTSGTQAVVLEGAIAPGTGGGTFSGFDAPSLNDAGDLAFLASVSGGSSSAGVFRFDAVSQQLIPIAVTGDVPLGVAGASFTAFTFGADLDDTGRVIFDATLSDGRRGVFQAQGVGVPLDSPLLGILLFAALGALAALQLRRRAT